ncbi:MAG TPA: membrane protein insertase YidC [Mucilaginibacter sp.]|nr:membrane protein insertase YidC [Mucilaginibacter sp.]
MDKNTFTGLFLIMVIMAASFFFMKPSSDDLKKERLQAHADSIKRGQIKADPKDTAKYADSLKAKTAEVAVQKVDSAVLKSPFGAATVGTDKFVTLENKDVVIKLSAKGGRVYSVELKNYKTFDNKPLILFDGDKNQFGLSFTAGNNSINTDKLYFTPSTDGIKVSGDDSASVTMRLSYSPTQYIDYIYSLKGTGYKVGFTVKTTGLDQVIANTSSININWLENTRKQEKDLEQERRYSTVSYNNVDEKNDYLSEGKDDQKTISDQKLQWVSFKAHFFSSGLIAKDGFSKSDLAVNTEVNDTVNVKQMSAKLVLARNADGTFPMEFYFGPNQFSILKDQGYGLEKQIDLGWGPLKYINRFAVLPVFNVLKKFNWNYGLIIFALTIILKLVLSPLTYKSYLSMAKMRVLKPEMDEIKTKVGEDNPTLLQQEYLKLYKKAGVNPLGGCLPLLIQMPIVIAFFRFFPSLFELRGQSFLWMHDLSTYDAVISFHANIPFIGNHISLMCLLMTISTLIYTYFNNQISGATGQMKYIGYITPIIFLGALNSYPSGLNYYYFLANMMTFTQQYIIRLMVDDKKIHAQIQENKKKPEAKKKKGGFQAKMEEMMRQQQQLQQSKKK